MKNNKQIGNEFEQEFGLWLANKDMFVYNFPNKISGQPFDLFAAKGDIFYAFECKHCKSDYFNLSRVEDNQMLSLRKLQAGKNFNYYFVFKFEKDNSIRFCQASYINCVLEVKKKIHKDDLFPIDILEVVFIEIIISNQITFKDCTAEIRDYCRQNFIISNPDYINLRRLGKWTRNVPKYLSMYIENGKDLIVPIGLFSEIKKKFDLYPYKKQVSLADDKKFEFKNNINLYDYQEKAVYEMLKKGFGILIAPTGSGKTQMGITLASKLGYKALWLTHTKDLLVQSYERAVQYIDKKYLGQITEGKIQIREGITFATVQTLEKQDLDALKFEFNTVIVDECHRVSGTPTKIKQFAKVINSLASRHKYGLTATLHRADNLEVTTVAYIGNIAYEIKRDDVKDKIVNPRIIKVCTDIGLNNSCVNIDGTIDNNKLLTYLSQNIDRNRLIVKCLIKNNNNYNLILSHRIEQLESIFDMLPDDEKGKAVILQSKLSRKNREKAIEDMRLGNKNYMFATYSLAKEGLDIQRLDRLYLVSSSKDKAVVQQSVGRIMRVCENKKMPLVYDFVDKYIKANKDFNKRKGFYKECGCVVNEY